MAAGILAAASGWYINEATRCLIRRKSLGGKVIKLKEVVFGDIKIQIDLNSNENIFESIRSKYKLVLFELKSEDVIYVGEIKSVEDKFVHIKSLSSKAKWYKKPKESG